MTRKPLVSCHNKDAELHLSDHESNMSSFAATNKAGVIVGAVIGALLLLLLLLFLIWLLICCCHKRRYQKEVANEIRYCAGAVKNLKHP